jgi:phosphoribosylformimino-5-aminoimidazole carboxamide ribotide isomerase
MTFTPIPAVDIKDGRCVRLLQGDYDKVTVYGDDPAEMAKRWESEGAERLHVVDLDGAREGKRVNAGAVSSILQAVSIPVQVGGGLRSLNVAKQLLVEGAARVVAGTAAAETFANMRQWAAELTPERFIIGVDVRDGYVATRGWETVTTMKALPFCQALAEAGIERIFFTDVSRDGMLQGPNVEVIGEIVKKTPLKVIASGGVTSADDIKALVAVGAEGAIIGKALYDGRLKLADALAAAR